MANAMGAAASLAGSHERMVALLRELAAWLLQLAAMPETDRHRCEFTQLHERAPRLEVPALLRGTRIVEPDLVFTAHDGGHRVVEVWLIECQLSRDLSKRRTWQLYLAAFASELRCPAMLVIVAPDAELRAWLRRCVLPAVLLPVCLLEAEQVDAITEPRVAERRPLETILGALYHGRPPASHERQVASIRAALLALQVLDIHRRRRYAPLVMSAASPKAAAEALEMLRASGELDDSKFEAFSEFDRGGYSFHVGREEGCCEGLRRGVLDIAELRGFAVAASDRRRVDASEDLAQLERWYQAVRTETPGALTATLDDAG